MKETITQQIHNEHGYLLNLCDQLESFLDCINENNISTDNEYLRCNELIDDLRYVLINIHHPKDRQLTDSIGKADSNKLWIGLLHNFHYPASMETLNDFDKVVKAATKGSIISKEVIYNQGLKTIQHLRLAIDFEEQVCLPYAEGHLNKSLSHEIKNSPDINLH